MIPRGRATWPVRFGHPGLIDVHAHGAMSNEGIVPQQNWMQYSNLSFGITTIHDPANDTQSIFATAELQKAGAVLAPRIFSTGLNLYGAYVAGVTAQVDSYEDALFHVRRMQDAGAFSVKSYQFPRREQRQQVIAAARALGMMVVPEGGAHFQANMSEIVDGHTGIEHSLPLGHIYEDVLQLWSQSEVGYTPTLGVAYGGLTGETYWYKHTNPRGQGMGCWTARSCQRGGPGTGRRHASVPGLVAAAPTGGTADRRNVDRDLPGDFRPGYLALAREPPASPSI